VRLKTQFLNGLLTLLSVIVLANFETLIGAIESMLSAAHCPINSIRWLRAWLTVLAKEALVLQRPLLNDA
jgi:hypothetical protein